MKVLIIGAGALGARFAYLLKEGKSEVTLADQWQEHIDKIKKEGLKVILDGKDIGNYDFPITKFEDVKGDYDVALLFVKSMQLEETLKIFKDKLQNTKVLCMLNGLGHWETISKYIDEKNIYMGVTTWSGGLKGPGCIDVVGSGKIEFSNILDSKEDAFGEKLEKELNNAKLNAVYSNDIFLSIWNKAALNITSNSLCTILECDLKELFTKDDAMQIIDKMLIEIEEVAKTQNVDFKKEVPKNTMIAIRDDTNGLGKHYPSMYQDMKNRRKTEVDYLSGYISDKGKKNNIQTPICDMVSCLIRAKEKILGIK